MKSGWPYEKTSSGARRPDRADHRWSANWFSGRGKGSRRTDRQSGRSGIWPHYADGIGGGKFTLSHYRIFGALTIQGTIKLTWKYTASRRRAWASHHGIDPRY